MDRKKCCSQWTLDVHQYSAMQMVGQPAGGPAPVVVELEKQKLNLSRTMDVNQKIIISSKNTLEKPRYKRTDNFGS